MASETKRLSELPIGSKIRFGRLKSNGDTPIEWTIASKDHSTKDSGYPVNAVTIVTDDIINFMAFDAKEPLNALQTRKENGNNRYRLSNIRQWLNSNEGANEWFLEQNIAGQFHYNDRDTSPSQNNINFETGHYPYDNLQGFLSMFKEYEKSVIQKTKVKTATHPEYDYQPTVKNTSVSYDETLDSVFLLSCTEVGLGANNSLEEGHVLDYFKGHNPQSHTSEHAYEYSPYSTSNGYLSGYRLNSYYPYALRSPELSNGGLIKTVGSDGLLSDSSCSTHVGIKVAVNLRPDTLVTVNPDSNGVYHVQSEMKPNVTIVKNDFMSIDFKLEDVLKTVNKIKLSLNGEVFATKNTDLENVQSVVLPFGKLVVGNNDLTFECLQDDTSKQIQTFVINLEQDNSVTKNDFISSSHGLYKVIGVTKNNDGTQTFQVDKNLNAGIYKGDNVEKMLFNYQPSVYVTDIPSSSAVYKDMELVRVKYDKENNLATEEWTCDINGTHCYTKMKFKRSSIHEDVSISKVRQIFNYKNESL